MEMAAFLRNLEDLIEADPGSLTPASVLADLEGWDSMAIMGFIAFCDEELGAAPAPRDIKACSTVADLTTVVGI